MMVGARDHRIEIAQWREPNWDDYGSRHSKRKSAMGDLPPRTYSEIDNTA